MSKNSKVATFEAENGKMIWERSAVGHIGDIHLINRKEGTNVALIIDSMDVRKTRIAEYSHYFFTC